MPRKSNGFNFNGKVRIVSREGARRSFDREARKHFKMRGKELIRKLEAGEFGDPDDPYRPVLVYLMMQIPFVK